MHKLIIRASIFRLTNARHVLSRLLSSATKVRIKDLAGIPPDSKVSIEGWVKTTRKHKMVTFVDVNDGSCVHPLQVVVRSEDITEGCNYGAAVKLSGTLVQRPKGRPSLELHCDSFDVCSQCDPEFYPFQSERAHELNYTRKYPHLRPRMESTAAVLRVRNCMERLIHAYYQDLGYIHVHTPIVTSNDCEGAGELFRVIPQAAVNQKDIGDDFFGIPAFLTVSAQLHLEACALGVGNVYTLSPAFRAEKSRPQTHLSEFYMLEAELAFTDSIDAVMEELERTVKYVLRGTLETCQQDVEHLHSKTAIQELGNIITDCLNEPFIRMDYQDAVRVVNEASSLQMNWGDDLSAEHEKLICTHSGNRPVFVINFPRDVKPFYAKSNDDDPSTSASFDLLFPTCGELAGGTIRENRHDVLVDRLQNLGLAETYQWYTDLRRFGGVSHGGFGLGFDRLVKFLLGVRNIRDVVPFPRARRVCQL